MCTLVILRRPGHSWPLILASNRDEVAARPWKEPARHWPERPETIAGLDETGGGSWLGVNDYGLVAGVLNRFGTLGPMEGKRSRGELVLEALDHAEASVAKDAMLEINPNAYRPFNLLVADARDAFWLSLKEGAKSVEAQPIPEGISMLTAHDLNDKSSKRIAHYLPLFEAATIPQPQTGNWGAENRGAENWQEWQKLMASVESPSGEPEDAMFINEISLENGDGFGTRSTSLISLAGADRATGEPFWHWLFSGPMPRNGRWRAIT